MPHRSLVATEAVLQSRALNGLAVTEKFAAFSDFQLVLRRLAQGKVLCV